MSVGIKIPFVLFRKFFDTFFLTGAVFNPDAVVVKRVFLFFLKV